MARWDRQKTAVTDRVLIDHSAAATFGVANPRSDRYRLRSNTLQQYTHDVGSSTVHYLDARMASVNSLGLSSVVYIKFSVDVSNMRTNCLVR